MLSNLYTLNQIRQLLRISSNEINDTDLTEMLSSSTNKFENILVTNGIDYSTLSDLEKASFKQWILHDITLIMNDEKRFKNATILKKEIERMIKNKLGETGYVSKYE